MLENYSPFRSSRLAGPAWRISQSTSECQSFATIAGARRQGQSGTLGRPFGIFLGCLGFLGSFFFFLCGSPSIVSCRVGRCCRYSASLRFSPAGFLGSLLLRPFYCNLETLATSGSLVSSFHASIAPLQKIVGLLADIPAFVDVAGRI